MTFRSDLEKEVHNIFANEWKQRDGRAVPNLENLSPGNDAVNLPATVLYADMADSTILVDSQEHHFAAALYKAYLRCAARIILDKQGIITAYDGDRVMAVFRGDSKNTLDRKSVV